MMIETGRLSSPLAVPLALCFLPALLHLALTLPHSRPLLENRPYLLRWIYGLPILALLAWVASYTVIPILGVPEGNNMGFLLARLYGELPAARQNGIALLGLTVAVLLPARYFLKARAVGWRQALAARPGWTILTLLGAPICAAVVVAQGRIVLGLSQDLLDGAALVIHAVLYSQFVLARVTVLALFPIAIGLLVLRNHRAAKRAAAGAAA